MAKTAAILYKKDGYNTNSQRLLGRQSASEGFLKALVRHSKAECLYCYTDTKAEYTEFCEQIRPLIQGSQNVRWIPTDNPLALAEPGVLYKPDPIITQLVWQRRYTDPRTYSICGVTHTLASKEVMQSIGDLLIAPVQPWDAIICTSQAVKTLIERIFETWGDYLAQRIGSKPEPKVSLPVIPLGVDCDAFPQGQISKDIRNRFRQQLGINSNDIVILFVGRLIFHAKAHPVPMYLALERATQATNTKVHLIQAGWFEDQQQELAFKNATSQFCPSVNSIFLDGRQAAIRQGIWSVADIFISLADNIQETFGLTPIEAMAAGLPVIVSDWNGYQETVRHEVDGFLIPTLFPPAECGLDFAANYYDDSLNYSTYIGHVSLMSAVDVEACTQALITLITNPELRQKMGENGRQWTRQMYDWSVVIRAYEALWQELAELRSNSETTTPLTPGTPPYPLCDDPCRVFAHYPTQILNQNQVLSLGSMAAPEKLEGIRTVWMTNFGANKRSSTEVINEVVDAIATAGSLSVGEIIHRYANSDIAVSNYLYRTLVYLIKFDVLRLNGE